jgi:hypothetical protein
MITVRIYFFNKETEDLLNKVKIEVPDEIVFEAADSSDIGYINARPFDVPKQMIEYIIQKNPELKILFETCIYEFIGRHGLGPEYD